MNNTIRVLGLNDDNHTTTFYSEDRIVAMSANELIPFLGQAHLINYNIRGVYICDMPEDEIFDKAFDIIDCNAQYEGMTKQQAFDILWAISEESIYL